MESSSAAKRSGSDLTEHIPKKPKTEECTTRESEETHFSRLVDTILAAVMMMMNVSTEAIQEAKRGIIQSFCNSKFHEIDFSLWEYSCAYFYRYGAHGAGLTRHKVIKALQNCNDLVSKIEVPTLNILSFGGGPGNDIIGFCSALCERNVRGKNLKITVTDIFPGWSSYVNLLNVRIKEGNFGKVSELFRNNRTTMSFIQAPSAGCSSDEKYVNEYVNELKNADVILMVKVLSIIVDKKEDIVGSIYEKMKKDAFLIFIDSPFDEGLWTKFECLYTDPYLADEENKYTSSFTSTIPNLDKPNNVSSKAGIVVLRK